MLNTISNVKALDPDGKVDVVVNAATGTGTGQSFIFTPSVSRQGKPSTLNLQAIPTGTFTSLTANLEASSDGGTTWNTFPGGGALNLQTTPIQQVSGLTAQLVYRINITAFAGGTSVVVNASAM